MSQETIIRQNSNEPRKELKILITGDKPKNLLAENPQTAALAYSKQMTDALETVAERVLRQAVETNPGKKIVLLSGLELGAEQAAARRALEMGIEVRAFLPHREHGKNWTSDFQKQYRELIEKIEPAGGAVHRSDKEYSPERVQLRDYRMVDEAQRIISLHNPANAPAHQKTLDYAAKHSKEILNVWNEAEKILGEVSKNSIAREAQNQTPKKIEIRERITREDVRSEPGKVFLFGDNLKQNGYGGQAREMRGEKNAVGIPSKKEPANRETSFFNDKEFDQNKRAIDEAFLKIPAGKTIVVPQNGIGTGLARMEEKAPRTFAYLNEKLAEIGFDNRRGKAIAPASVAAPKDENKVVVQNTSERSATEKTRLLDLNNIKSENLKLLEPTAQEVAAVNANRSEALSLYAERLRGEYRENKMGLRDGLRGVSDALERSEQITIACNCRGGEMCHADVVKIAIEKINAHVRNQQIQNTSRDGNESRGEKTNQSKTDLQKQPTNPRTERAINEILAVSETDKLLAAINQTDGRNQSEQASHLGQFSQFVRDVYERGGNVIDGALIVPKENLTAAPPIAVTTQDYAARKLGEILKDEGRAKTLAPNIVEYGNQIAGGNADGETRIKVFAWMYDALEGKSAFLEPEENAPKIETKEQKFETALAEISRLAEEMKGLEPLDKIEFAPLNDFERDAAGGESIWDENRQIEEIYEAAIGRDIDANESEREAALQIESGLENEQVGKISIEGYERIDLSGNAAAPPLPAEFSETENARLLTETLPEIDRQLETGVSVKEILKPFHENVRQSQKFDALNRLEAIYQKQRISEIETKLSNPAVTNAQKEKLENDLSRWQTLVLTPSWDTQREILTGERENAFQDKKTIAQAAGKSGEMSQTVKNQVASLDVRRQNVIELKTPAELFSAWETAEKTFYQKTKIETADLRLKLAETKETTGDERQEIKLKQQLNDLRKSSPSFAFKLENSSQVIVGEASQKTLEERSFVSAYVNYQLRQPETRFRHENERYRIYAARLEGAATRADMIKFAAEIRIDNAALGMKWKESTEKEKQPRPLTSREMQFLFTETSPAHYTPEMTVAKLAYAHSGESRKSLTASLLKGEIRPGAEAQKLIDSLEARLNRRELKDSLLATKHFFESLKTANENLKYKNEFDHREIYRRLPPQERDFVYLKTTQQKENLEYRLAFQQQELIKSGGANRSEFPKLPQSEAEKSFHLLSQIHQARILGERIETAPLESKEISERDFRAASFLLQNQPPDKISKIGAELKQSQKAENQKLAEILEVFSKAQSTKSGDKTIVQIKLPENSTLRTETYQELLERFYPDSVSERDKFKFSAFHEKTLEEARIKGQDAALKDRQSEIGDGIYAVESTTAQVFQTERAVSQDLSQVSEMQYSARAARSENLRIVEKYASRAALHLEKQNVVNAWLPKPEEQKQIVTAALRLSAKSDLATAERFASRQFFDAVQTQITVSDFQKFSANEKIINENQAGIRKTFAEITAKEKVLAESRVNAAEIRAEDKLAEIYSKTQNQAENRLTTIAARNAFENSAGQIAENKTVAELLLQTEKDAIKTESFRLARIAVEPDEKYFAEKESEVQAAKLADAIENAHELSKQNAPPAAIAEAFEVAESERTVLLEASGMVEKSEDKPLSLRLYEAEMNRAEKELWRESLSAKILAGVDYSETGLTLNLDKIFAADEREQMKLQAAEIAKSRLEPKELDADHRKISQVTGKQALATFKQLEQAHNVFQFSNDKSKIHEAFSKLDREAGRLNQFRQNYDKIERFALLRDGVKTDLGDLLRKNQNLSGAELSERTSEILRQNFAKAGFQDSPKTENRVETLTREIVEKIETKQAAAKEKAVSPERSAHDFERGAPGKQPLEINQLKEQKAREAYVLTR